MPESNGRYLAYSPALEQPEPDEHVVFDELSRLMQHITRKMATHYRHAYRPVHAKSHGLLVGRLEVLNGLPEPLAQGLFAMAATYPVLLRLSTNPGDLLADTVSTPKGFAVKVLNVDGEMLPNHAGRTTQDFVCVNAPAFSVPNPKKFLESLKPIDKTLEYPEELKHAVSLAARGTNAVLRAIHLPSSTLEGLGAPNNHILGETFTTVAPLRFGEYVAKVAFVPASENLKALTGKSIDLGQDFNAIGTEVRRFFRDEEAVWEVRVQLAIDEGTEDDSKKEFPIEHADKEWPEGKSAWQTVARITVPPQESYSDARQLFVDEQVSFSPWHGLLAHQPLGGIMRSRLKAYEESRKFRVQRNARETVELESVEQIPD